MNEVVKRFLKLNDVCVVSTNEPYSASVFYIYDDINNAILFISSPKSRHIKPLLSAAVYEKSPIKGVQIIGELSEANKEQKALYLKQFKSARFALNHIIYSLKIKYIKYTDNTLVLPKKLEFNYE